MPHYAKTYQKRRYKRKNNKSFSNRVKRVIKQEAESKYFDTTDIDISLLTTEATAMNAILVNNIPQGDSVNERIGNSVFYSGFNIKWVITGTISNSLRILVLLIDNYSSDIATQVSTDFDDTNVGLIGQYPRNVSGYNYKVLKDTIFNIDPDNKGSISGKWFFNIKKNMSYIDGSTANPVKTMIRVLTYTDNTTVSALTLSMNSRSFYKDC